MSLWIRFQPSPLAPCLHTDPRLDDARFDWRREKQRCGLSFGLAAGAAVQGGGPVFCGCKDDQLRYKFPKFGAIYHMLLL